MRYLLACLLLSSCLATGGVDYPALQAQVTAVSVDLAEFAEVARPVDPELAKLFDRLADSAGTIGKALESNPDDVPGLIDAFLAGSDPLLDLVVSDPDRQARARLLVIAARAAVRHAGAAL